jgi:hypothetical protein
VWSVSCCGEIVAVPAGPIVCVPLFPDRSSADYFTARHWPNLAPVSLSLRELIRSQLPFLAEAQVPVGVGVAPRPDAIVLSPVRLRKDLLAADANAELPSARPIDA